MSNNEYVWMGRRIYENRTVYEDLFSSKSLAKKNVARKQGGVPEDFTWEGLHYEGDENLKATKELEPGEKLVVKKMRVSDE